LEGGTEKNAEPAGNPLCGTTQIAIVFSMDKKELISYLHQIDRRLSAPTSLCVYGSAAFILLDEPDRTSLDIHVAGPYSQADLGELRQAAEESPLFACVWRLLSPIPRFYSGAAVILP